MLPNHQSNALPVAQDNHYTAVANALRAIAGSLPMLESSACAAFLVFLLLK